MTLGKWPDSLRFGLLTCNMNETLPPVADVVSVLLAPDPFFLPDFVHVSIPGGGDPGLCPQPEDKAVVRREEPRNGAGPLLRMSS